MKYPTIVGLYNAFAILYWLSLESVETVGIKVYKISTFKYSVFI